MNITKESTGELTATIKISVGQDDYKANVDKAMKDYQKKASFKGFRPGKVPTSLIHKLYGKTILGEEVNKLLNESLTNYLTENKLNILGQPLPDDELNNAVDFDNQKEFDFYFNIGLAPEINIELSDKLEVVSYEIESDDSMVDKEVEYLRKRFGKYNKEQSAEDKDIVHGEFAELDAEGNVKEGGINNHTNIALEHLKNEALKSKLIGAKSNDKIVFTSEEILSDETEAIYYLKIKKEEFENIKYGFQFTIEEITRIEPAEMNAEFFLKVFPKTPVENEADFREKIKENLNDSLKGESEARLNQDIMDKIIDTYKFNLPDAFLKRWLKETNDKLTDEQIDHDFDHFSEHIKWEVVENKLIKENNLEVGHEEVKDYAKIHAKNQLINYGLPVEHITDEYLESFSADLLKKEETVRKIYESLFNKKVMDLVKSKIKLVNTKISFEEFVKLENRHKHEH